MLEKWFWLPDWASDLSLWEDDLIDVSPDGEHSFVAYEEMISHVSSLYDIKGLSEATHVVGWGLGSLALMKNASNRPKNQNWILLSPFTNFCSDENNWNQQNMLFIANQTKTSVDPFLNAFMELFDDEFGDWVDEWKFAAKKMSPEALGEGLAYLAQNRIESEIPFDGSAETKILYGKMDQAVKPSMTIGLKDFLPYAQFKERPKAGHWPPMLLF